MKDLMIEEICVNICLASGHWEAMGKNLEGLMSDIHGFSEEKESAKFFAAGTEIYFENATPENFGAITVVEGVMDIVYFDNTTALVRMGKFPVLSAIAVTDCWIIIDETDLNITINLGEDKSRSRHTKWYDKSCWQ